MSLSPWCSRDECIAREMAVEADGKFQCIKTYWETCVAMYHEWPLEALMKMDVIKACHLVFLWHQVESDLLKAGRKLRIE